jgi:uncharacterized phage-associated protein
MASVHDIARYILREAGPMSAMKLQKLAYYAQAWHLVWDEERLFPERIEAWANGPVVPDLYRQHRGQFQLKSWPKGSVQSLTSSERETVDIIIQHYGDKPAHWLSELTHKEDPWRNARKGLAPGARSDVEITPAAMSEYYGSLVVDGSEV